MSFPLRLCVAATAKRGASGNLFLMDLPKTKKTIIKGLIIISCFALVSITVNAATGGNKQESNQKSFLQSIVDDLKKNLGDTIFKGKADPLTTGVKAQVKKGSLKVLGGVEAEKFLKINGKDVCLQDGTNCPPVTQGTPPPVIPPTGGGTVTPPPSDVACSRASDCVLVGCACDCNHGPREAAVNKNLEKEWYAKNNCVKPTECLKKACFPKAICWQKKCAVLR